MPAPAGCNALFSPKGHCPSPLPCPHPLGAQHRDGTWGSPCALLPGRSNIQQIQNRNTLKDTIIIIQTILLVIFISVPMLLFLEKVSDSISSSGTVPGFAIAILPAVSHVLGRLVRTEIVVGATEWEHFMGCVGLSVGAVGPGLGAGDGGPHSMLCW